MKRQAEKRRELHFEVGEDVFLKLRPNHKRSLAKKRCEKLSSKFYGPYKVLEKIGEVAYRIDLSAEATIRNVFHISQLKKMMGNSHALQGHQPEFMFTCIYFESFACNPSFL